MTPRPTFSWTLPPGEPLTAEQRRLVTEAAQVVPAVVRAVAKGELARRWSDDLASVASEGLLWSAQRFDATRGTSWLSFAFFGARMRCLAWLRALRLREPDVYLDEPISKDHEGRSPSASETRVTRIRDHGPGPDALALRGEVLSALERLPERERLAVRRLLEGRTLEDVGTEVGKSRETVRKWQASGLRMLREEFGLLPRRRRRTQARLDAPAQVVRALRERPHTTKELRALTGYTRAGLCERMRALGAEQVGTTLRNGQRVPLWGFPERAT